MIRVATVLGLALLLAGCASSGAPAPLPTPEIPAAATVAPEKRHSVPVYSTRIPSVVPSVPPIRVQAPAVDVDVDVVPVGVRADGQMELPDYVGTAGWYSYGPDPTSDEGTTVIAAHVDSLRWGLGPFARLKDLALGAEIIVTTGDGGEHRYLVESVTKVPKAELPVDTVFSREGPERLALITCGGTFDREALRYSDNVLVTAVPAR